MGRLQADEMIEYGGVTQALSWHLQSNHYPPVPLSMIPACKKAIKKANAGNWDEMVNLPDGVSYRGMSCASVREIVRAHHLDSFLEQDNG